MNRKGLVVAAVLGAFASVASAQGEFSKGSQITGWKGLKGRETALFEARVVDVVCELTGDCASDCGAGKRQMGLVRAADNKLLLAAKNIQPLFNGASDDLVAFCGQDVMVDGLLVGNPSLAPTKIYQVHLVKAPGSSEWRKANEWTKAWKRRNPAVADRKGPWFFHDPLVAAQIDKTGRLGLGPKADAEYFEGEQ